MSKESKDIKYQLFKKKLRKDIDRVLNQIKAE